MYRDVYSRRLKINGEEDQSTLLAANNYVMTLIDLRRFAVAKALSRKTMPVARRVLGENHDLTLKIRFTDAKALYKADDATLNDVREAVTTLEETERIARRVLGGAHPQTTGIDEALKCTRAALRARETPPTSA